MNKTISYDKMTKLTEIEDFWLPLIFSLNIFSFQYMLAILKSPCFPSPTENYLFFIIPTISFCFSSILLGRSIRYWEKWILIFSSH